MAATSDELKKELETLLGEVGKLIKLSRAEGSFVEFGEKYQNWYSRAVKVVALLGNDRLDEFKSYYLIDPKRKAIGYSTYVIQDYIKGVGATLQYLGGPRTFDHNEVLGIRILAQKNILESLSSRIDSVLADVEGKLFADIQDEELGAARELIRVSPRAAGALAGVVLERHLQRVATNHGISIRKKNPTISDLNDPLKQAGVYETPTWRRIQLLADLRNLCSHKKDRDPQRDEIDELISGVNVIVKTIF